MSIRPATESDLEAMLAIYNHAVATGTASFDLEPRTAEQERVWFIEHQDPYAVMVWEEDGVVAGWGSIGQAMVRAAYHVTGDLSVYVHADHRRRGVGEAILRELVVLARARGFHSVTGFISGENVASLAMVEKLGFMRVAWLAEIGRKFDRWLSVAIYQLFL
jgi:L-amino acid N-acyltransferase YncA